MQLKSNYKILKEHNLLIIKQKGILNLNSMMGFIKSLNSDSSFCPKLEHIVDLHDVVFDLTLEDINKYVNHLENNSKIYGHKRIALVTNTPNQVAYSTLFKLAQEQLQPLQNIQIFSTHEKAYNFLKLENLSYQQVSTIIKEL